MENLVKDEDNHIYYWKGKIVPSVTEIAKPISFSRLNDLPKWVVENARNRGKAVHEYAEEYLLCGELDFENIEAEYIPFVENFVNWARTYKPKVLYTEYKMGCEEFAGTLDLICEIDKEIVLVDYKTTSVVDKKSLSVQLEGYDRLAKLQGIFINRYKYLHLKKDGYVFKDIVLDPDWFDLLLQHNKKMKEKYNGK